MKTENIALAAQATLQGTAPFPEIVTQLLAEGVEYYQVDYVALRKTFYNAAGQMVTTNILFEGLPPVADSLAPTELKAAILDSQRNGQKFRDFTRRAMEAGVQGYFAFLRGRRVTYWGRDGEQHTEWFPAPTN
jgi:uncharacterized protein YbcV (DUF1398 family)